MSFVTYFFIIVWCFEWVSVLGVYCCIVFGERGIRFRDGRL